MGRICQFVLLALTLIVLTQGTIMAQGIPQGSYQQTCNNVAVNGNVLTANCQDSRGNWVNAQLPEIQRCNSDIVNDNGALRCTSAGFGTPGAYRAGNGPTGSYMQSCQDVHVGGDDLHARCQTRDGNWHETKLDDYNKCHGDILNDNGNLKCVSGVSYGAPGPYQGGYTAGVAGAPYTQTCKDIKSHGDDLEARCKTSDGSWNNTKLDDFRKCRGQIINDDGNLRCVAAGVYSGPAAYQPVNGPTGSYVQSCKEIHVGGDDLHARCQTADGGWHNTKLDDYNKCHGDIVNDNGDLHCSK